MRLILARARKNIFALESATVLRQIDKGVQLAVNTFGQGRGCVYQWPAVQLCKQPPAVPGDSVGGFGGGENSPLVFHKLQCRSACLCKKTANTVSSTTRMNRSRRPFTGGTAAVLRSTLRPMRSSGTRSRKETVCGRHRGRAWFPDGMPAKNTTGKKSRPPGQFLRPESRCVLTGISPLQCVW